MDKEELELYRKMFASIGDFIVEAAEKEKKILNTEMFIAILANLDRFQYACIKTYPELKDGESWKSVKECADEIAERMLKRL